MGHMVHMVVGMGCIVVHMVVGMGCSMDHIVVGMGMVGMVGSMGCSHSFGCSMDHMVGSMDHRNNGCILPIGE